MTKQKAEELEEQYYNFVDLIKNSFPLEKMSLLFIPDIMGYGANLDEKIFNLTELHEGFRIQKEQSVGLELQFEFTPISRRISYEENVAIYADEIRIMMTIEGIKQENALRLSIIFEFIEERWICTHFHASRAINVEGDAWATDLGKKKNEELQSMVDERTIQLQNSILELKSTQAQLIQSEKLASLGELTAGIAHEIQNPLNFVNNFSELSVDLAEELKLEIGKLEIPEKVREYVGEILGDLASNQEKINHHGKRAAAIVTGMLQHARTSSGKKEPTDLNALADEYLRLSYHGLRAKDSSFNSQMVTDFDPAVGMVEVIPQDIGRVFLNIINNAFYATQQREKLEIGKLGVPFQPTVSISSKRTGSGVEFRIKDNGTGIPDEVKARIFQPFFTTKPTGQGTGLGLSLAYDIVVKGHGGTLEVESTEGKGTEFILTLPAQST